MIEQIEKSNSLRIPRDQKTAFAALQFYGMIEAGIGIRPATDRERAADLARRKNEADAH